MGIFKNVMGEAFSSLENKKATLGVKLGKMMATAQAVANDFVREVEGVAVAVSLSLGGNSYCTGKGDVQSITISLPDEWVGMYSIPFIIYRLVPMLIMHECGHARFTDDWFAQSCKDMVAWGYQQADAKGLVLPQGLLMQVAHHIVNSVEDGRIERIDACRFSGFDEVRIIHRGNLWKEGGYRKGNNPSSDRLYGVLNNILTLSTTYRNPSGHVGLGMYIKGSNNLFKDYPEAYEIIKACKPYIRKAINEDTCEGIYEPCMEIFKLVYPLVEDAAAISKEELEKLQEDLKKLLEDLQDAGGENSNAGKMQTSEEKENTQKRISQRKSSQPSMESEDADSEAQDGNATGSGNGESGEDSEDDSEGTPGGNSNGDSKDDSGDDSEETSAGGNAGDETEEESEGDTEDGEDTGDSSSEDSKGGNTEDDSTGESENDESDMCDNTEDWEFDDEITDYICDGERQAKEQADTKRGQQMKRSDEAIAEALRIIQQGIANEEGFEFYEEHQPIYNPQQINPSKLMEAKAFKRFFDNLVKNKSVPNRMNMKRGKLNTHQISKICMGQDNCFMQNGKPYEASFAAYILKDNSGSMHGQKHNESCYACSVLEYAMQDYPVKIAAFDEDYCSIHHTVIKDWTEKKGSINFSETYRVNQSANGGNKDGADILVAAEELSKRPERDKLLIVLSDGQPSTYTSEKDAYASVNYAVRKARKYGIKVVAIFFGDDKYLKESVGAYTVMYEKDIIGVPPEMISAALQKVIKKQF